MISKKEIQNKRNKYIIRVILTFFIINAILMVLALYYKLSWIYIRNIALILGIFYLYQIYSYRRIKCPNCGKPLLTSYGLYAPVPEECGRCKTKIE